MKKQETLEDLITYEMSVINRITIVSELEFKLTTHDLLRTYITLGAKWQQEQYEIEQVLKLQEIELKWMEYFSEGYDKGVEDTEKILYSEEDLETAWDEGYKSFEEETSNRLYTFQEWFEQFKKK